MFMDGIGYLKVVNSLCPDKSQQKLGNVLEGTFCLGRRDSTDGVKGKGHWVIAISSLFQTLSHAAHPPLGLGRVVTTENSHLDNTKENPAENCLPRKSTINRSLCIVTHACVWISYLYSRGLVIWEKMVQTAGQWLPSVKAWPKRGLQQPLRISRQEISLLRSRNEKLREAVHKPHLLGLLRYPDQTPEVGTTTDRSSDQVGLLLGRER